MISGFAKIFQVENSEYGYAAEDFSPVKYGEYIKLHIPKLTGTISETGVRGVNSRDVIANALECKPSIDRKVNITDSVRVMVRSHDGWENKTDENGIVKKGTPFIVEFINGNIHKPYTTTK